MFNSEVFQEVKKHLDIHFPLIFEQLLSLAIVLFLIYYRSPNLFFEPRFWAEEGQGYFAFAYSHSIFESLIAPHYGYFNLVPNLGGILATFAPLELAPLVTTWVAALVQLIVSSYVIFSDSPYLDSFPKKLAVACFIQILCPAECWLTTISSQYFLSIIAFFILVETDIAQKSWSKWPSRIMLSVSVLTSPIVTFLLPAFVFKSLRTRSHEDWLRVAIVSVGAFIQVIAFIPIYLNASDQLGDRFHSQGFDLLNLAFWHLSESMVGTYYLWIFNYFGLNIKVLGIVLMAFELYLLYLLAKSLFCKQLQLHAIAFILLTVPTILLSPGCIHLAGLRLLRQ